MRFVLLIAAFAVAASAQITYKDAHLMVFQTVSSTMVLGVNERDELQTLYWGAPIPGDTDFSTAHSTPERSSFDPSPTRTREEYPAWGGTRYLEPAVKITRADGDRDVVLKFIISVHLSPTTAMIGLADKDGIQVNLYYRVWPELGIIEKHAVIKNSSKQSIHIESAQSGVWSMPPGDGYRLTYVSGRWAAEDQISREPIHPGTKVLESRRGTTSHNANPWFMIDDSHATEETGRVWFGALGWSGNWRLAIEQTPYNQVRVTGGFNTFDFGYPLAPGKSLETPPFYAGFSGGGFGGASRNIASNGMKFFPAGILPGCAPYSTIPGKLRRFMWTSRAKKR
jgi:alpha-galactosidase